MESNSTTMYGIFICYNINSKKTEVYDEWIDDWTHNPAVVESDYFIKNHPADLGFTGTYEECKKELYKYSSYKYMTRTTVRILPLDDKSIKKNELSKKERLSGRIWETLNRYYVINEDELDKNDPMSKYNILNDMCTKMINALK